MLHPAGNGMRLVLTTVLALLAFAANSVLCRVALSGGHIDAVGFSVVRIVSGASMLFLVGGGLRRRLSLTRGWASAFALVTYAVPFAVAYTGMSAATGALILFGTVQVTMIAGALWSGERPRLLQWVGLLAALGGLLFLIAPGLAGPPVGAAILMVVAGVSWGIFTLRGRGTADPLADMTRNFIQAVPLALVLGLLTLSQLHGDRVGIALAVASGAVASGLGYVAWYSALGGLTATRAAVAQLSVPVLAAAGGMALLGEPITIRWAVSSALILGGIALVLRIRDRAPRMMR